MAYATRDQIAHLLNITPRMVNMHVKNDGMPSIGRGQYDIVPVVQWYIARLKKEIEAVRRGDESQQLTTGRILRAKASMAEDKLRERRGELIPLSQLVPALERIIISFKSHLLGFGAKFAPNLSGKPEDQIRSLIEMEIRALLTNLAKEAVDLLDLRGLGHVRPELGGSHGAASHSHAQRVGRRKADDQRRNKPHRVRPVENK